MLSADTPPTPSDRLEEMTREELLMAARLYRTLADQRMKLIGELDVQLEDARRRRR